MPECQKKDDDSYGNPAFFTRINVPILALILSSRIDRSSRSNIDCIVCNVSYISQDSCMRLLLESYSIIELNRSAEKNHCKNKAHPFCTSDPFRAKLAYIYASRANNSEISPRSLVCAPRMQHAHVAETQSKRKTISRTVPRERLDDTLIKEKEKEKEKKKDRGRERKEEGERKIEEERIHKYRSSKPHLDIARCVKLKLSLRLHLDKFGSI
ncbi:hypothetical protein PUN28_015040 [Cardiocondyla obscurior]|uniref:Uncharacterized protein n=1 Tax=Cardiocondyla obscurior TaxID=286306 RepID=A0AAW2F209_9HYME